jgi:hypothetical protein
MHVILVYCKAQERSDAESFRFFLLFLERACRWNGTMQ